MLLTMICKYLLYPNIPLIKFTKFKVLLCNFDFENRSTNFLLQYIVAFTIEALFLTYRYIIVMFFLHNGLFK